MVKLTSIELKHLLEYDHLHKTYNDALSPLCSCCIEAETTKHCFLPNHFYNSNQATLINGLKKIPISFSTINNNSNNNNNNNNNDNNDNNKCLFSI